MATEFQKLNELEPGSPYGEFWKDDSGNWYWHVKEANHELLERCTEGDGYERFGSALDGYEKFHAEVPYRVLQSDDMPGGPPMIQ